MEGNARTATLRRRTIPGGGAPAAPRGRTRLTLLRGFRLERDRVPVPLPLATRRLLALLAIHDRPLQRLFVAGTLWIDSSEQSANASLRTALWRLGRIGFPVVDATRRELALAADVQVDLHEATARARRLLRDEEVPTVSELDPLLRDAELLPDWYDDWVLIEREHFRQLRLHALERLCDVLTAEGAFAAATEVGLACVAAEPLRESAHRRLVRVHLAEGNPGEALRQYRLCRRLLRQELGLEPSAELRELVAGLRLVTER